MNIKNRIMDIQNQIMDWLFDIPKSPWNFGIHNSIFVQLISWYTLETGPRFKVSSERLEEWGIEPTTPGLQD